MPQADAEPMPMHWTVQHIIDIIDQFAPPHLAMQGDVIGLQVGNRAKPVERVALALDAYPDAIHHAVTTGVDLLVTHHALLYHPPRSIDTGTARGKALAVALAHDLAIFNAHTNLDIVAGGVNDVLAQMLGLMDVEILDTLNHEPLHKLVVFVPHSHHEAVLTAVAREGAGHIGRYSHCTFSAVGVGTFMPEAGANPFIGMTGRLERVEEIRLETVVPASRLTQTIDAMLEAHPYEEVAYDVYPLGLLGRPSGLGRVGNLPESLPLSDFATVVRTALGLDHIRFGGVPSALIRRVAVVGGAGGRWAAKARALGADVLVTSDVDHHSVAEAWQDGLAIVDATHAALETPVLEVLARHIVQATQGQIAVNVARVNADPFTWI